MAKHGSQTREDKNALRQRQAERALERVNSEGEALATSAFARTANRAKDHLSAGDVDPNDPIEVWGTRIGRVGGAIFAIILVLWLISHFSR